MEDSGLVAVIVSSFWVCQRDSFCIGLPKNEIPNHLRILSRKKIVIFFGRGVGGWGERRERDILKSLPLLLV